MAPASIKGLRHLGKGEIGEPHRDAVLAADLGGEPHILVREAESERWRVENAGQEALGEPVERPSATGGTVADRLEQRHRVDARFDAHGENFGQRGLDRIARAIVDELGNCSGADLADVIRLIADRIEDRAYFVKTSRSPPTQSASLPDSAPLRSTAHRGVEHGDAALGEDRMHAADQGGRIGRQIEEDRPGLNGFEEAVFAEDHRLDVGRGRK